MSRWSDKQGTALITALLITAVVAAVAVGLSQSLTFGIARSGHLADRDQAYWYALGARDFAESALVRSLPQPGEPMRPNDAWAQGARSFEIENGFLSGEVRDGQNCFNLNSLVQVSAGVVIADDVAAERFESLMRALNIPSGEAQAIVAQAVDWIDSDTQPGPGGAEDLHYAERAIPHRAANSLFVEREELLALPAMNRLIYEVLRPHVCALPSVDQPPLNLNTLRTDQAALLAAFLDNRLSVSDAALIISRRPTIGFDDVELFWSDPLLAALELEFEHRPHVGLRTSYFEIFVEVQQGEMRYRLTESVELQGGQRLIRHHQRFGVFS
ncbi:type II secretion system minor pseudopilin GspK [Hyphobacterium sp.]|uniref:type II secretion system minor pseudopilin GspK n=1 Tax=Hyphobacterium sp. TaxID=2004662 RepID=UPI003BABBE21